MPTGYTAAIKDGISFEQFVWSCARAMGALISMRDDPMDAPIPDRIEPEDYYGKQAKLSRDELTKLYNMSSEEIQLECDREYEYAVARHKERADDRLDLRNKYNEMLAKVVQWMVPTPDHEAFRQFMISQLRDSINHDCDDEYYSAPEKKSPVTWFSDRTLSLANQTKRYSDMQVEENTRAANRTAWITALRESVPPPV